MTLLKRNLHIQKYVHMYILEMLKAHHVFQQLQQLKITSVISVSLQLS